MASTSTISNMHSPMISEATAQRRANRRRSSRRKSSSSLPILLDSISLGSGNEDNTPKKELSSYRRAGDSPHVPNSSSSSSNNLRIPNRRPSEASLMSLASVRHQRASNSAVSLDQLLLENQRLQLLETMDKLACHLPQVVLAQLIQHVVNEENEDQVLSLLGKSILLVDTNGVTPMDGNNNMPKAPTSPESIAGGSKGAPRKTRRLPHRSSSIRSQLLAGGKSKHPTQEVKPGIDMALAMTNDDTNNNIPLLPTPTPPGSIAGGSEDDPRRTRRLPRRSGSLGSQLLVGGRSKHPTQAFQEVKSIIGVALATSDDDMNNDILSFPTPPSSIAGGSEGAPRRTRRIPRRSGSLGSQLLICGRSKHPTQAFQEVESLIGMFLAKNGDATIPHNGEKVKDCDNDSDSDTSSIGDDHSWMVGPDMDDGDDPDSDDDSEDDLSLGASNGDHTLGASNVNLSTGRRSHCISQGSYGGPGHQRQRSYSSLPALLLNEDNKEEDKDQGVARLCQGRLSTTRSVASCHANGMTTTMNESFASLETSTSTTHTSAVAQPEYAGKARLESSRHTSALLFVDISGFTKLSQSLEVESLSKVINSYFQKIVEIIRAYKGDILKFAGDALLVEWKSISGDEAPLLATICAAKLVDVCSDFAVRIPEKGLVSPSRGGSDIKTTLLNIHCAIGFGQVVGTHVGNQERMEYVLCGDALGQIATAMKVAMNGEVVASPETVRALDGTLRFDCHRQSSQPHVIAAKSELYFRPVDSNAFANIQLELTHSKLSGKCEGWNMSMLRRLHDRMAPYVHPAVRQSSLVQAVPSSTASVNSNNTNNNNNGSSIRLSVTSMSMKGPHNKAGSTESARLRDVLTVFIQPILPENVDLMSSEPVTDGALDLLQQIMMIVQSEIEHFRGQLRQFIVDDKGLVVILNFGLPGSTFPNMTEERAIPCVTNIKTLLKTELDLNCRIGASHGKVYCGVVGGVSRHEYAVLGPAVNLAARLMCNKENPGILVDRAFRFKAGPHHPFRSLRPIVAKGYDKPVRIYEPAKSANKAWVDIPEHQLVGRSAESFTLLAMAKSILRQSNDAESASKMVFICGPYGVGKSSFLSHSTRQIEQLCQERSAEHHVTRYIFGEDDSFKPFSIVRPLFLHILRRRQSTANGATPQNAPTHLQEEISKPDEAQLYLFFLQTCLQASVPMQYIEMFAGLIFTDKLSDGIGKWSNKSQKMAEWNKIAQLLVHVYLQMTDSYKLVVLALDDLSGMDEFSWKIVRQLYTETSKFLILGAARNEFGLNIGENMASNGGATGSKFSYMKLGAMGEDDITALACKRLAKPTAEVAIAKTVYCLSEGNPSLACQILDQMYDAPATKTLDGSVAPGKMEGIKDVLLSRLDSLPTEVRLHLNCGAMLGLSFSLSDALAVMEKYNGITAAEDKIEHGVVLRQSLLEAEESGFLSSTELLGGIVMYSFTHPLLLDVISQQILQEWKDRIQRLIDGVRSSDLVAAHHDSWRDFAAASNKPIRSV